MVEIDGSAKVLHRFHVYRRRGVLRRVIAPTQVVLVASAIVECRRASALTLDGAMARLVVICCGDRLGDFALKRQHVFHLALVLFGPDVVSVSCFYQLHGDSDAASGRSV